MDDPIISKTAGNALPEVGQEIPVAYKRVITWKRRVLVGWKHQNDTPGGLRSGKIWGWTSEGNHFQVYDEEFNRSEKTGDVRFCGPANFTMVRMFHAYWGHFGEPPLDMNWEDKARCRYKYHQAIRRWRIQNDDPVDDDRENSVQPPGTEMQRRARRPRTSRAGRPTQTRQVAIRSLNLTQREELGSDNEQEDTQMSDDSDSEGHSSQEPRTDSPTSNSFRYHNQSMFVQDRHRTRTPAEHKRDNSVKLDPDLLQSPGFQHHGPTLRPSLAPERTQAVQTQTTESEDTNGDPEIPGTHETTTAGQRDSAATVTSSSEETLVVQDDMGMTSLENTEETQQTMSSAGDGPRAPSIDTVNDQEQMTYPPLPELHEVEIKDEQNGPIYEPMEFNWDAFKKDGEIEVIVIEDDEAEVRADEVDGAEPIVIDDD